MGAIGFDFGGTKIQAAYATEGNIRGLQIEKTPNTREAIVDFIVRYVKKAKKNCECKSIGIGLAGARQEGGTLWCPNIPALTGSDFERMVSDQTGFPVFLENDAQCALRGECWKGILQGAKNAVMVSVGTGIGAGFLIDGHILRGTHGACGAVGWLCLREETENWFRFEDLASGTALGRLAHDNGYLTSKDMISAVRAREKNAVESFKGWVNWLGRGIASIASMLDVETVIIGGGLSREFDLYEEALLKTVQALISPNIKRIQISPSLLGEQACLYGAIALGEQAEENRQQIEALRKKTRR